MPVTLESYLKTLEFVKINVQRLLDVKEEIRKCKLISRCFNDPGLVVKIKNKGSWSSFS